MPKIRFLKVDIFVALKAFLTMCRTSANTFSRFFFWRKKKEKIQIFDKNKEVYPSVKVANIEFFKSPYFYSLESFCIDLED